MSTVDTSRIALPLGFKGTRHPDLLSLHNAHNTQHLVQFYDDSSIIVANVAFLVRTALTDGECAIVIATASHGVEIRDALAASGLNVYALLTSGRLAMLDASEALSQFMIGNRPDPVRFDQVVGRVVRDAIEKSASGFVFGFGEMVAVLCAEANPEGALELERLWNELRAKHNFSLYCTYSFDCLSAVPSAETLVKICGEHSVAIP
jgi:MEDS: MEthanogen/methylotroph, DcmR Sensory domain